MKKSLTLSILVLLAASLLFSGCFDDDDDDSDKGGETFELIGKWKAEDVEMNTADYSIVADVETEFTKSTFEGTTTVTSSNPPQVSTNSGEIVSFSNEDGWYVAKLLNDSTNSSTIGKYGMTRYTLSEDGKSYTGTSYSYEDTEEEAKASTTPVGENIEMIKVEE